MGYLPREKWGKILVACCYVGIGILTIHLFFTKLLGIILPFGLAFIIARMLKSPIERLNKRTGLPKKVAGICLVTVVIGFIGFVFFLLINQLVSEARRIFELLSSSSDEILFGVTEAMNSLEEKLPFISKYADHEVLKGTVNEVLKNIITFTSSFLAGMLTSFVKLMPNIGLFFVVFVIASYYFTVDHSKMLKSIGSLPNMKIKKIMRGISENLRTTGIGYVKAYTLLLAITFALLLIGFTVMGISYATTLALVIALLDMLPVIGTGTILVPWALICFVTGNPVTGIGLLVIFGIVSAVREISEPKIIGRSIGMHPLLTLIAMYSGYRLFGIPGLLLLPPVLNFAMNFKPGEEKTPNKCS